MNKKFLSTLLTVVASSLTLNAAPVSKTRAKVVEVEVAPAKLLDIKIPLLKSIFEGTGNLGIEMGRSNFSGGLNFSYLPTGSLIGIEALDTQALKFGVDISYYENQSRRSGFYYFAGVDVTIGRESKANLGANVKPGADTYKADTYKHEGYEQEGQTGVKTAAEKDGKQIADDVKNTKDKVLKALKKATYYLSLHAGFGHKLELSDLFYISNSIEFEKVLFPNDDDKRNIANVPFLKNIKVNLIEIRLSI